MFVIDFFDLFVLRFEETERSGISNDCNILNWPTTYAYYYLRKELICKKIVSAFTSQAESHVVVDATDLTMFKQGCNLDADRWIDRNWEVILLDGNRSVRLKGGLDPILSTGHNA